MEDNAALALCRPFETGDLDWPEGRILFLGARALPGLPAEVAARVSAVQPERGAVLALARAGIPAEPALAAGPGRFAAGLVLVARQHGENAARLATMAERLDDGALLVVAGTKTGGAERLAKTFRQAGLLDAKASKHHALVFWSRLDDARRASLAALSAELASGRDGATTGAFNAGTMDEGTAFLLASLPDDIHGAVADFGAGTGLIAEALAARFRPAILDLYESNAVALDAARARLAGLDKPKPGFFWQDVIAEPVARRYDRIVTNPPFHDALGNTDPRFGIRFLAAALAALRPGGVLLAVANRDLPYEQALKATGADVAVAAENARFKVLTVRKRR